MIDTMICKIVWKIFNTESSLCNQSTLQHYLPAMSVTTRPFSPRNLFSGEGNHFATVLVCHIDNDQKNNQVHPQQRSAKPGTRSHENIYT